MLRLILLNLLSLEHFYHVLATNLRGYLVSSEPSMFARVKFLKSDVLANILNVNKAI